MVWCAALSELCTPRQMLSFSPWRHARPATRAATRAVWVRVAKLGAPFTYENCRSRQYCLCHPPLITCMRQAREQNSGVVRATDEPAEQQMQQRWERSATAPTMPRGSEASFTFVGTHRDIVSSRILHRSLLLCRSPLIICVWQTREQNNDGVWGTDELTEHQMQQR